MIVNLDINPFWYVLILIDFSELFHKGDKWIQTFWKILWLLHLYIDNSISNFQMAKMLIANVQCNTEKCQLPEGVSVFVLSAFLHLIKHTMLKNYMVWTLTRTDTYFWHAAAKRASIYNYLTLHIKCLNYLLEKSSSSIILPDQFALILPSINQY